MSRWFQSVVDLQRGRTVIRDRAYGVIETEDERFQRVLLRPFPKLVSRPEIALAGRWTHHHQPGNRCRLYYNQPCRHRNFLALRYVVSTSGTTFGTFRLALRILDDVARIKRTDAIVCDVANQAISDRLLARWGWAPLGQSAWHRLFIKRFYGDYPESQFAEEAFAAPEAELAAL